MTINIDVYTDGACRSNKVGKGRGGWASVVYMNGTEMEYAAGGETPATNNTMELTALLNGIALAAKYIVQHHNNMTTPATVRILSDSQYCVKGITEWIKGWKRNGWRTKTGEVKNLDLWLKVDQCHNELIQLGKITGTKFTFAWVKGHAGIVGNERCDLLANIEVDKLERQ